VLSFQTPMHRIPCLFFFLLFALTTFAGPYILPKPPLVGIGVILGFNETGKEVCIRQVFPGAPASSAGITLNSRITRIDDISTDGLSIGECTAKIRGPEGTKVKLELTEPGTKQTRVVEFVRQPIHTK